jgi:hypothetical protein
MAEKALFFLFKGKKNNLFAHYIYKHMLANVCAHFLNVNMRELESYLVEAKFESN